MRCCLSRRLASSLLRVRARSFSAPAAKARLDFKNIRDHLSDVIHNIRERKCGGELEATKVADLYNELYSLQQRSMALRTERNELSKKYQDKEAGKERAMLLKKELQGIEVQLSAIEDEILVNAMVLPNISHPDSPKGSEDNAKVVDTIGELPVFPFPPRDHVAIGEIHDLFQFDWGAKVSGSRFVYFKNDAVFLELALIHFTMNKLQAHGFTPMMTPDLVRTDFLDRVGFNPRGESSQIYNVEKHELCLSGTGEVPLASMLSGEIVPAQDLPIRSASFNHCFRTEVGSRGSALKGIYRLHQFSKVEMFIHCKPSESDTLFQGLVEVQKSVFRDLGLHCRVLDMPTEELGASAYRKYDIEAWMPGRKDFGEVSSASNCTDYQSRRLNMRFKNLETKTNEFLHTLNATGVAIPRAIIAILETHQLEDGRVRIPDVLRPYMGGREFIGK